VFSESSILAFPTVVVFKFESVKFHDSVGVGTLAVFEEDWFEELVVLDGSWL